MILDPINLVDCAVFVFFLIPQLLFQTGIWGVFKLVVQVLPFLTISLPLRFIGERYLLPREERSPFVQSATAFQDIVIRCVRYAFANVDAGIGRIFFSKPVVYPFFRWRMLRNGYFKLPIGVHEVRKGGLRGLWICDDHLGRPDVIIYYCHGGGFSMGSAYFYLEFLIAWLTRLRESGFKNPAIFAIEYTLVPDGRWPQQFKEISDGYRLLIDHMGDGSRICVSGDSAGATLILSRLLQHGNFDEPQTVHEVGKPRLAVLISPWTHLISPLNRNTPSDYLDAQALRLYGRQYLGRRPVSDPVISPGLSSGWWKKAQPCRGYCIIYGEEEVFAPAIEETVQKMRKEGARVKTTAKRGGIHAWPVVSLFLGTNESERLEGLNQMTAMIVSNMGSIQPVLESSKKKKAVEANGWEEEENWETYAIEPVTEPVAKPTTELETTSPPRSLTDMWKALGGADSDPADF